MRRAFPRWGRKRPQTPGSCGALLLGAIAIAACSSGKEMPGSDAGPDAGPPTAPAFDAVWRISTHNSYWVNYGTPGDLLASGTQERLADQLLFDHARGVEIDIHKDPSTPGTFDVFHTMPGNDLCDTLSGCLAMLRAFHYALPEHEALHVTLELKEITAPTFDATHTIADLDKQLTDELGALLYRPAELMARCPGEKTLSACARAAGWPSTHELRGRVVISVLGNWDGLPGAQATKDYIDYATTGDIRDRAAFPMASSWQLDHEALNGEIYNLITQADLDRAFAQSAFMQIEDTADPHVAKFVAGHGVVRADGAVTPDDQTARVALGVQLLQTDSPWVQADDHGPSQPFREIVPHFDAGVMTEPGARLSLGPAAAGERVFAYATAGATSQVAWETTASSGMDATRIGCLRATTALGSDQDSLTVCRDKIPAQRDPDAGVPDGGLAESERVIVHVTLCQAGACATTDYPSQDPAAQGPGDMLRLEIDNHEGGTSCVTVRSATAAGVDLAPRWADLGSPACFASPLLYQGLATGASASFFGSRREIAGKRADLRAADFTGVVAEAAGGGSHDAAALLTDQSFP